MSLPSSDIPMASPPVWFKLLSAEGPNKNEGWWTRGELEIEHETRLWGEHFLDPAILVRCSANITLYIRNTYSLLDHVHYLIIFTTWSCSLPDHLAKPIRPLRNEQGRSTGNQAVIVIKSAITRLTLGGEQRITKFSMVGEGGSRGGSRAERGSGGGRK